MKRSLLITESTCVLLIAAAAASFSHLWRGGVISIPVIGASLIVPVIASLMFVCISVSVPDLYAVGKLRFPINVTLPCVYVSILILTLILISRVGPSIMRVPEKLNAINIWSDGWVLMATLVTGIVCLSALGAFIRERPGSSDPNPSAL